MGEAFIVRKGGGNALSYAVIGVTYPAGSTCTCSDGTKTLNLKDTSGQGLFLIPYAGTWTVTCTNGIQSKSIETTITTDGECKNIEIIYEQYLYSSNPSNQYSDVTGGWTCSITDNHGDLTFTDNYMQLYVYAWSSEISGWSGTVYTKNPVTIIGNTLEFVVTTGWNRIGISSNGNNSWNYLASKVNVSSGTHTIDVSNFIGQDVYICASQSAGSNWGTAYAKIVSIRNY